jgi:hypothetical protein
MQNSANNASNSAPVPPANMEESLQEIARLQKENEALRRERDCYLRAVKKLLPVEDFSFDAEELAELERNGCTFDDILSDLKALGIEV